MGSFMRARPLLEHARRSPGPPSQTNGTELWVLAADHSRQPTAGGQRSTARCCQTAARPAARLESPSMWLSPAVSSQGQRRTLLQSRCTRQTVGDVFIVLGLAYTQRPGRHGTAACPGPLERSTLQRVVQTCTNNGRTRRLLSQLVGAQDNAGSTPFGWACTRPPTLASLCTGTQYERPRAGWDMDRGATMANCMPALPTLTTSLVPPTASGLSSGPLSRHPDHGRWAGSVVIWVGQS